MITIYNVCRPAVGAAPAEAVRVAKSIWHIHISIIKYSININIISIIISSSSIRPAVGASPAEAVCVAAEAAQRPVVQHLNRIMIISSTSSGSSSSSSSSSSTTKVFLLH